MRSGEGQLAGVGAQHAVGVADEAAGVEVKVAAGLGETLVVIEGIGDGEVQHAVVRLDQAFLAVVEVAGIHRQGTGNQYAVLVIQVASVDRQVVGDDLTARVVQVGTDQHQVAASHFDAALAVVQRRAVERGGLPFTEANQTAEVDDGR